MPITYRKVFTDVTEEELGKMKREELCLNLNDKQRAFCEHYVKNQNVIIAAKKAGYSKKSAHCIGWKIRQSEDCNRYIAWLKLKIANDIHVNALDIIDQYVRIAFADITDFVEVKNGRLRITDTDMIDGQIVTKIKQGKDGITVELASKLAALDKLERYFDCMPKDWRERIEEKKIEIMKEKLELEKRKMGEIYDDDENDGFIDALRDTAKEVWSNENEDL